MSQITIDKALEARELIEEHIRQDIQDNYGNLYYIEDRRHNKEKRMAIYQNLKQLPEIHKLMIKKFYDELPDEIVDSDDQCVDNRLCWAYWSNEFIDIHDFKQSIEYSARRGGLIG